MGSASMLSRARHLASLGEFSGVAIQLALDIRQTGGIADPAIMRLALLAESFDHRWAGIAMQPQLLDILGQKLLPE